MSRTVLEQCLQPFRMYCTALALPTAVIYRDLSVLFCAISVIALGYSDIIRALSALPGRWTLPISLCAASAPYCRFLTAGAVARRAVLCIFITWVAVVWCCASNAV